MQAIFAGSDETERREAFAEMLIDLRQRLGDHGEGWQQVSDELHRLIEWLFNGSETYAVALELYERRFSLHGGNPAAVLRTVLDEQMSPISPAEEDEPAVLAIERRNDQTA